MPALAYSPILVEEPLAYPLATLALWLIARVYVEPTWGRAALAVLACTAAMLTRTQLSILFALFVLGLLWLCWQSERFAQLALVVLGLGLGRARHARSRCRRRHVGVPRPPLAELARHDRRVSGADSRARGVGVGSSRDRNRSPSAPRWHRGTRKATKRGHRSEDARVRHHRRLRARRVRRVRGHQGSADLDHVLDPRRRAEPDLPLPDPLRRDCARVRPGGRTRLGDRRRDGLHRVRRHRGTAPSRQLPVLRGARALAAGVPEPGVGLARRTDREHAADRVLRLRRRARRAPVSASRLACLHGGRGKRGCRGLRLDTHGRGLCGRGRATAREADRGQPAGPVRLGRSRDRWRLGSDPRSADDRRSDGGLPHGVLQPLGQEGVEHRRDGARPGRDPYAGPRERRRNPHAVARRPTTRSR